MISFMSWNSQCVRLFTHSPSLSTLQNLLVKLYNIKSVFFFYFRHCTGFEIDEDALEICQRNLQDLEIENTDLVKFDITKINPGDSKWHNKFDTILMNPPFGTKKNEGKKC